jgi:hypothetical protein
MSDRSCTILERLDITAEELTAIVDRNPSLGGILLGYAAEWKLRSMWFSGAEITKLVKHNNHNRKRKGDLVVAYKGHDFIVECKSLQTHTVRREAHQYAGKSQCDASDRRTITLPDGSRVTTTCLQVGEFDLLAVNLFAFENRWRFVFAKNLDLPRTTFRGYAPEQRQYLLATLVTVTWPPSWPFREEPFKLLDEIIQNRMD